jgi:hypothetical protein
MTARPTDEHGIPVLTDVITAASPALPPLARQRDFAVEGDELIAELQTKLASRAFALTEDLLRTAFAEMEANLFEQITATLRRELPELIDATLREHLDGDDDRT